VQKDREQTSGRILQAVGRLLAQSGFRELGVNSIAHEAGVDKVLIYRYFGGLPELLSAFAADSQFWPDLPELAREAGELPADSSEAERAKFLLQAFGRALRKRALTQEIMRWELMERNELTDALAKSREAQSATLFDALDEREDIDIRAIGSLLAAGQTYLILRSKTVDVYNGLQLNSEDGWARIERAVSFLVDAAFQKIGSANNKPLRKAPRKTLLK
jgi:AcrR family transcriptional regulator